MLWLLRHADAEDPDGRPDAERPLTDKGRAQARAAGAALAVLGVRIDACLASPRVRARETAALACAPLGVEVQIAPELDGGRFDAERVAAGLGEHVLLVGHNPAVAQAVLDLTGARVRMRKGALAGVDDGELHVFLRPAELAAIAPRA
ncbi:MAG TPA: histidine phosphatase family protein [Conexibacter sp.]|jgi:phosphohistidine phosphatase|nr:histidine phosphatase family protein [Conexibacter sp.]